MTFVSLLRQWIVCSSLHTHSLVYFTLCLSGQHIVIENSALKWLFTLPVGSCQSLWKVALPKEGRSISALPRQNCQFYSTFIIKLAICDIFIKSCMTNLTFRFQKKLNFCPHFHKENIAKGKVCTLSAQKQDTVFPRVFLLSKKD